MVGLSRIVIVDSDLNDDGLGSKDLDLDLELAGEASDGVSTTSLGNTGIDLDMSSSWNSSISVSSPVVL